MPVATAERFDPAAGLWTTLPPMPTPRRSLAAAALGGCVYALGGWDEDEAALGTVERYDPAEAPFIASKFLTTRTISTVVL